MTGLDALYSVSFVLLVVFLTYTLLIVVPFVRRRPAPEGDVADFQWHAFIPCRDEAAVISATIIRMRERFPAVHLWVIDDASVDGTGDVIAAAANSDAFVHPVIRQLPDARTGKGDALNAAFADLEEWLGPDVDADRLIVMVVDADGELASDALRHVAGPRAFGDQRVGAAQVAVRMSNLADRNPLPGRGRVAQRWARYLIRMQDVEFRTTIAAMQTLRMRTVSVGLGGNGQFARLSALRAASVRAGAPWGNALLEDYEIGIRIMMAGYRTTYIHDTSVSQEALPTARRLLTQRTRWCQGGMQCARYLPQIYSSRSFTNAGALEAGYFLVLPYLQLLGIVVWPSVAIAVVVTGALAPGGVLSWALASAWVLPLWLATGILPFFVWPLIYAHQEGHRNPLAALGWGLGYWLYMYQTYVCVVRACGRMVARRNGWTKTRRNSESGRLLLAVES
ncbi:glycosyltransferase family 2 protein [Microbacterium laevaniformans]|uniref:glycosyltransferase family 2 protein n=1 Tax=Microbacterium laevaniformans TaxID=36807 RepID=UPI00363BBA32